MPSAETGLPQRVIPASQADSVSLVGDDPTGSRPRETLGNSGDGESLNSPGSTWGRPSLAGRRAVESAARVPSIRSASATRRVDRPAPARQRPAKRSAPWLPGRATGDWPEGPRSSFQPGSNWLPGHPAGLAVADGPIRGLRLAGGASTPGTRSRNAKGSGGARAPWFGGLNRGRGEEIPPRHRPPRELRRRAPRRCHLRPDPPNGPEYCRLSRNASPSLAREPPARSGGHARGRMLA